MADNILDLTSDDALARATVVFPSGKRYALRMPSELSLKELRELETLGAGLTEEGSSGNALDNVQALLASLFVSVPAAELDSLSPRRLEKIMSFFTSLTEQPNPVKSLKRSRARKGSTAAA